MALLQTILITLFTLAVLIGVHEWGHFWVARRCGIKVLRFSIGFGKPLCRWHDKRGTEFVIAAVPFGGYVKMLDEREGPVDANEQPHAFNRQPIPYRLATVAAGPIVNFMLAIMVYWWVFLGGVSGVAPIIGTIEAGSAAHTAGLEVGQEIVSIDGEPTPTWEALHLQLLRRMGESGAILFAVQEPSSGVIDELEVPIHRWLAGDQIVDLIGALGIELYRPPVLSVVGKIVPNSPADQAGLQPGDTILTADGENVRMWNAWVNYVRARPGDSILVEYERQAHYDHTNIVPKLYYDESGQPYGQVGMTVAVPQWPESMRRTMHYNVWEAMVASLERTWQLSVFTLSSIKKMLEGVVSSKNLSGPITIAKVAAASVQSGVTSYLSFLALLSVSLGVLNLLPIPVLDGGHIVYILIEGVTGRALPEKIQLLGYQIGLLMILAAMFLALYNDIVRW